MSIQSEDTKVLKTTWPCFSNKAMPDKSMAQEHYMYGKFKFYQSGWCWGMETAVPDNLFKHLNSWVHHEQSIPVMLYVPFGICEDFQSSQTFVSDKLIVNFFPKRLLYKSLCQFCDRSFCQLYDKPWYYQYDKQ